jgi:hypothetical protein
MPSDQNPVAAVQIRHKSADAVSETPSVFGEMPCAAPPQGGGHPRRRFSKYHDDRDNRRNQTMSSPMPIDIGISEPDRAAIARGLSKLLADSYTL